MRYLLIGILVVLICTAGVQAVQEYDCSETPGTNGPLTPVGDIYFTSGNPYAADMVFYVDDIQIAPNYRTLPSPMDAYKGYQIITVAGPHLVRVERPGYVPLIAHVTICTSRCTFVPINLLPVPVSATTTSVPKSGNSIIKPGYSGLVAATTTTPASSTGKSSQLQAPTIAVAKTTTVGVTTPVVQAGGTQNSNTGNGQQGTSPSSATHDGVSGYDSQQAGSSPAGSGSTGSADPANTGSLSVTTTPAGAAIFLDGVQRGISPATIPGLTPGDHTLLLKLDGYADLSPPVTITAGQTQTYTTALAKKSLFAPGFEMMAGITALAVLVCMRKRGTE